MDANVSFDGWLLGEAIARGATVVQQRVVEISFAGARPQVHTPTSTHTFDLVVLATGVNGHPPSLFGVAYQPPRTEMMAQGELPAHGSASAKRSIATAHVYLDGLPGLIFAALVPKGRFISVSILGQRLPPGAVRHFLARPEVEAVQVGARPRLCGCRPQISISPAQRFFADRFVAIGDAAVTRLYKDGIGSAFQTAKAAAYTAVFRGVGARDFAAGYAPACRAIQRDNRFGQLLFSLWRWSQRSPRLGEALLRALDIEAELPAAHRRWRPAVWSVLTGGASYEAICRQLMRPQAMTRLIQALHGTKGNKSESVEVIE
jgi:flavin-dependent dehydrogenase